jgi:hypothetical protein
MPVLTGRVQPEGALVDARFAWGASAVQARRLALQPVPPPVEVQALLDTGAEVSCIDGSVVRTLGLAPDSFTLANLPAGGGLTHGFQYRADLTLVHPSGDQMSDLTLADLLVVELPLGPLGYQSLIGRDVLDRIRLLYDGPRRRFRLIY